MIVSDSFIQSQKARDSDFTTNACKFRQYLHFLHFTYDFHVFYLADRPLVVQFASKCAKDFADATELIVPFSDGVDMNCGCPQR